jgi:serine/threonine-protein kinase
VGRYVVHDRIAAGGMATVHVGRLLGAAGFSRTVAIKRLHDQYARDPEFVAMLLDEARLAAQIRHPNVVQTVDVVAEEDELLVVMDYVEGDSVAHLAKLALGGGGRVPHPYAASIVAQALQGLHAAHEAKDRNGDPLGIVHRDVSPQNVLVGVDGVARVLDFGIAKAASRSTSTEEGQLKGKTAYMAPEQLRHGAVDRRTDVFAAGVVLWELLAGRRLFFADGPGEIMARVLEMPIDPPHAFAPDVPIELSLAVLRALERDPEDRFQTAEEMALAIEDAVALPRAKELGAWVARVAKGTIEARAALVQEVERSSHKIAAASTDPELQRAIEAAERRRAAFEMPTERSRGDAPGPALARGPNGALGALGPLGPLGPGEEGTGLATYNSTVSPIVTGANATSRAALAIGALVALACARAERRERLLRV